MTYPQLAQRIRVPSGFLLLPLLLVAARSSASSLTAGAAVGLAGLLIRAWASGHVRKNEELTIGGPYAYTRNPLYLGTLLLGAGAAGASGSLLFLAVFLAFYLAVYVPVMKAEAENLRRLFPDSYENYSRAVPLFLPRLAPYRIGGTAAPFEPSLYLKHREYRAACGFAIIFAMLVAKWLLTAI